MKKTSIFTLFLTLLLIVVAKIAIDIHTHYRIAKRNLQLAEDKYKEITNIATDNIGSK